MSNDNKTTKEMRANEMTPAFLRIQGCSEG